MDWLVFFVITISLAIGFYLLRYGAQLKSLWGEPVLKYPVVIFESDDWGPAEDFEARRLTQLAEVLSAYRDSMGRHPVMTLGVVLSVPDSAQIRNDGGARYHALRLDHPQFDAVRHAIMTGLEKGVFAAQLHGMAHYLPRTLLSAAEDDSRVADWLAQDKIADPWELPSALQSRWIDGSKLPTGGLGPELVLNEAAAEVRAFREVFGFPPEVAVPPTFIWTRQVEEGWASQGIRYVMTPGRRYAGRDVVGRPVAVGGRIRNGQLSEIYPVRYLVRDVYFEPRLGHQAEEAVDAVTSMTRLGRPTLFETHRFNFNGPEEESDKSLQVLGKTLELILKRHPGTRFLSSAELGRVMENNDPDWLELGLLARFRYLLLRARTELPLVRRLFRVSP